MEEKVYVKNNNTLNIVTREEVLEELLKAKAYIASHFKKTMTIKDAIKELENCKSKKIHINPEDSMNMIFGIYAKAKNNNLDKRMQALEMVLNVYRCIYRVDFMSVYESIDKEDSDYQPYVKLLDEKVDLIDFPTDPHFVLSLTTSIFNFLNGERNFLREEEFLRLEREFLGKESNKR